MVVREAAMARLSTGRFSRVAGILSGIVVL